MIGQQKAKQFSCHTPRTEDAKAGSSRDTDRDDAQQERRPKFWSRQPCGRQGRAGGAPLRGLGALTASRVVKLARHAHNGQPR